MSITVRSLTTLQECDHFQKVEQLIWGSDEESLVPTHVLITLSRNGGLVMGAYAEDGPEQTGGMVGIVAGWLGSSVAQGDSKPRIKFCSHMAGVLPAWQRQRVGLHLKIAQLEWVRAQGLTDWMTWTYDPLYRANGVFNIHRLGATCRTYIRDLYGEMTDVLNAGGPSDRCQVDWCINDERVQRAVERVRKGDGQSAVVAKPAHAEEIYPGLRVMQSESAGAVRRPPASPAPIDGLPFAMPIPEDIAALRRVDRALSLEWRYFVRNTLEQAFAAGYTMVDCLHVASRDWCYILKSDAG